MSTFALHLNTKKLPKVLSAFELVRGMSESELETLEILSDTQNIKLLERSIDESQKNKVSPIESIL